MHEGAVSAYPPGHDPTILRLHSVRDVQNSAPHLLPFLKKGQAILDIGCGPGSITISLAETVGPQGKVIGIDIGEAAIAQAKRTAEEKSIKNVEFAIGNAIDGLPFPDSSFDVVHAHQVLQHVSKPVSILREMRRLAKKPGGIISLSESDVGTFAWYPEMDIFKHLYHTVYPGVAKAIGVELNAGRKIHVWCQEAGITKNEMVKVETNIFSVGQKPGQAGKEEREWWASTCADRIAKMDVGMSKAALALNLANKEELEEAVQAWRNWGQIEDAWFGNMVGEIVCVLRE